MSGPDLSQIISFIKLLSRRVGQPGFEKGCFFCAVASELGSYDAAVQKLTDAHFQRLVRAFSNP